MELLLTRHNAVAFIELIVCELLCELRLKALRLEVKNTLEALHPMSETNLSVVSAIFRKSHLF